MMVLAAWVSAIATFLAVLVAVFKEDIVAVWRAPKLMLTTKLEPPFCVKTPISGPSTRTECYYVRVWICNCGKTAARSVSVFGKALSRGDSGALEIVEEYLPMHFKWSYSSIFVEQISPGMGRFCDIGHLIKPESGKAVLELDVEAIPLSGAHKLEPGKYRLELLVGAANCKPVRKDIEIVFSGEACVANTLKYA